MTSIELPRPSTMLRWYDRHQRVMPWRARTGQTSDPYRIWLSEIMLQQTTVAAVVPFFQKFIQRWPTLTDLAQSSEDDVLDMWAGLGYYRRARLLHACARFVVTKCGGVFPRSEHELLALPGFGPYTAAAVAAIAFDRPANVVDGNVERVIARVFAVEDPLPGAKRRLRHLASTLAPKKRPGDYAQALMDLGATICTPRSPKCGSCPWRKSCKAFLLKKQEDLPRREPRSAKPIRRAVAFVLRNDKGELLIRRRPPSGLLARMMEVPSTPWMEKSVISLQAAQKYAPTATTWKLCPTPVVHLFSHFTLEIRVACGQTSVPVRGTWIALAALDTVALPTVMKKIIHCAVEAL